MTFEIVIFIRDQISSLSLCLLVYLQILFLFPFAESEDVRRSRHAKRSRETLDSILVLTEF